MRRSWTFLWCRYCTMVLVNCCTRLSRCTITMVALRVSWYPSHILGFPIKAIQHHHCHQTNVRLLFIVPATFLQFLGKPVNVLLKQNFKSESTLAGPGLSHTLFPLKMSINHPSRELSQNIKLLNHDGSFFFDGKKQIWEQILHFLS